MSTYGENLGMAFQLRDDLLDYTGRKKLLGKETGNDLKEKKFTLPLLIALKNAPNKRSKEIMKLIKSESNKKFETVYYFVEEFGGIEYTQNKISHYANLALEAISSFSNSESKESLIELVSFVSNREY
jgi:octaprenyl-diphosphate synthase